MKWVNILFIVFVAVLLFVGGMFFVFGNEVLKDDFYQKLFSGELTRDDGNNEDNIDETSSHDDFGGGGSSNTENSDNDNIISGNNSNYSGCQIKRFSYSLRNFVQNISCQEWNSEKCVSLFANCSVEIYNLDNSLSGDFEIKYSIINSLGKELDYDTMSQNIPSNEYKPFSIVFDLNNEEGIDENSQCFFNIINIPTKEVCN